MWHANATRGEDEVETENSTENGAMMVGDQTASQNKGDKPPAQMKSMHAALRRDE